ncbi:4-alpha-glucanotransferase [Roseomonas marmotae]|uniref:4-alpha-glucanotransferase n=2 Tax=Roseomonas marmotae TaxID=2768161 RepID=A0ABS3K8U0_9PROT|nr:4-alpha-glucanotransferase [Roseomonas marmotae]MBO1073884.1 4-alpha-glucanotransferase [Roseomonas marmotae]QTI80965.1 4-alpha-glucanotransferase [Roseomonas marmotae]
MAEWRDAAGKPMTVEPDALRVLLGALGLPAASDAQVKESLAAHRQATRGLRPPLVTAEAGAPVTLRIAPGRYRIEAADGTGAEGEAEAMPGGARITAPTTPGYYTLECGARQLVLAVAPEHGHRITDACPEGRAWGLTAQIYSLRRGTPQGVGDYAALEGLAGPAAALGADAIAISPVHAQFSADPSRFSPYAPSSRARLDVRHAARGDILGEPFAPPPELAAELERLEALELVDWPATARARIALLRDAYEAFTRSAPQSSREAFDAFRAEGGASLQRHAVFEALHARQFADGRWHWREWPAALRDPESPAVASFAEENAAEVEYHAFLQWLADRGLAAAQRAARQGGMRIGLIADLAVGVDGGGSDAWSRQAEILQQVEIGAPPDLFNARGQGWGITSFSPQGLRMSGFAGFREMLAAAFRNAGGVRLDHVLGLRRLWLVPGGASPRDGAYLRYPLEDMLRLVALESHLNQGIVIGEDLGTVPAGFRPRLEKAGLAGMRVLWFEKQGKRFTAPQKWTTGAVSMTSTHDLATVAGWWEGRDMEWRRKLDLKPLEKEENRQAERRALWSAFRASGVAQGELPEKEDGATVADAAAAHIGRAACQLALLPLEDALAAVEQPNLPGTTDQHPNWRRRFPQPVDRMLADPAVERRLRGLARARRAE